MENVLEAQQQEETGVRSRRSALLMGGAALAGLALTRSASAQTTTPTYTDNDYLNFALNLEYLEAQFYSYAVTGGPIPANSLGTGAGTVTVKTTGSTKVNFTTPQLQAYATETAQDELNHVNFLRNALGATAVVQPNIDLLNSFNTLAAAAKLPGGTFDPFDGTEASFLLGAFIFEDVGVTAYLGAAPLISSSALLTAALGIHAVEAYHAGAIRTQIFRAGATNSAVTLASQSIATLRQTLGTIFDTGVGTPTPVPPTTASPLAPSTIVDVDASARVQPRTPTQVLNIVYGNAGATPTPGLFFPAGMNGTIK